MLSFFFFEHTIILLYFENQPCLHFNKIIITGLQKAGWTGYTKKSWEKKLPFCVYFILSILEMLWMLKILKTCDRLKKTEFWLTFFLWHPVHLVSNMIEPIFFFSFSRFFFLQPGNFYRKFIHRKRLEKGGGANQKKASIF